MAEEKIILAQIDIDLDQAIKDTQELKKQYIDLKAKTDELKKTEGETSAEYIKSSAQLKVLQSELKSQETITQKVIAGNKANAGSLDSLKAELAIVSKQWSALSAEERLNSEEGKKLSARKLELTEALKKEEKATGDTRRNVGNYTDSIKEATGQMGQFVPGANKATGAINKVSGAFKLLLANPIVAVITLIIGAFAALVASLKRSEEGQNALAKAGAVLSSIFQTIADVVTTLAEKMVKAFKDPQQAVKDLWEIIKQNLVNRVTALADTFVAFGEIATNSMKIAGNAIANLFRSNKKDLTEMKENLKSAVIDLGKAQFQLLTGIEADKAIDAFKELGKEIAEDARITKMLADRQDALDKVIRNNLVIEAKDRLKLSKLKNDISSKDKFSGAERLKLIDEENKLLDGIYARNLKIRQEKYNIRVATNAVHASTKADLDEEAKLLAEVIQLEAEIEEQRKSSIKKRITAQQEVAQEAVNQLNYELQLYLENNKLKLQDFQKIFELQKAALDEQLKTGLIFQNDYNLKLLELESEKNEAIKAQKLEQLKINYDNELALAEDNMFAVLDIERQGLEMKRQQEVEYAEKIGADVEAINKKYAEAEKEIERAKTEAKFELAADFAGNIATIFGEQTAIGKAAAIAETTINTYKGATSAYAALAPIPVVGPVLGIAAAGAAIASGLANVKKILAVKTDAKSPSASIGSAPTTSSGVNNIPVRTNVNPEIGAGIVARQTIVNNNDKIEVQPTLVIDEVTQKQSSKSEINSTSTI